MLAFVKDRLTSLNIHPSRRLGQNFMVEPGALDRVMAAAGIESGDAVLEIGPGLGALTERLVGQARRVVAVEIDSRLFEELRDRFAQWPQVKLVHGDILTFDPAVLMEDDAVTYLCVSNLPYAITSAAIRHLLEASTPPFRIVFTVQQEVAQRIVAPEGDMSLLAVSVHFYGVPRLMGKLKPGNFYPRPEVDSEILRIDLHPSGPLLPPEAAGTFFRIVKAGFGQRRKQIKNTLAGGLHMPMDRVIAWLTDQEIDPRRRAETLSLNEWLGLYVGYLQQMDGDVC